MATKVKVVSTKTIKPSSPTPPHLRNFNFCLLDQLAPPFYVPVVLFYSVPDGKAAPDSASVSGNLKTSLAQVLSLFYPLGGRVKGNACIDCNDEGALYLEAKAHFELSKVLSYTEIAQLQQFLPFSPYKVSTNNEDQVIVGDQANFLTAAASRSASASLTRLLMARRSLLFSMHGLQLPTMALTAKRASSLPS
ncbi:hypothetical protein ACJRO7_014959 [Eucalyptus globulus]|uniref:Uncharacterized protein n=1 Tax=Eucalyptus globulus TaxID=34317 RepID=A0ABD3L5U7_EUCGL